MFLPQIPILTSINAVLQAPPTVKLSTQSPANLINSGERRHFARIHMAQGLFHVAAVEQRLPLQLASLAGSVTSHLANNREIRVVSVKRGTVNAPREGLHSSNVSRAN